ncbi:hypothetical protein ACIQPP_27455 [Streptomyces violaceusniger]|uniref:hypothetical protein n=1 Tax=Streptomyces violaceusniger TaxID=68280 RepID=UPI0037F2760A
MCRSLSLNEGPAAPTLITIFGNALSTATGVLFGSVGPGTGLVIVSDTALNITTPPHGSFGPACTDTVDVTVTTAGGSTFPTGASCQYTYYQAPNNWPEAGELVASAVTRVWLVGGNSPREIPLASDHLSGTGAHKAKVGPLRRGPRRAGSRLRRRRPGRPPQRHVGVSWTGAGRSFSRSSDRRRW